MGLMPTPDVGSEQRRARRAPRDSERCILLLAQEREHTFWRWTPTGAIPEVQFMIIRSFRPPAVHEGLASASPQTTAIAIGAVRFQEPGS